MATEKVTVNKPSLERREAVIDAKEIMDELGRHTSDRAPEYGLYLMRIAGQKAKLFGLYNEEVVVRAEQIPYYIEKGMTVTVSNKTADGRLKLDILEEKHMTHRHDTVPVKLPGSLDEFRDPEGEETEIVKGAKRGGKKADQEEADENETMTRAEWEAKAKEEKAERVRTVKSLPADKGNTPPAGRAGVSSDPAKDQSIEESKNAENPPAQPFGSLKPGFDTSSGNRTTTNG